MTVDGLDRLAVYAPVWADSRGRSCPRATGKLQCLLAKTYLPSLSCDRCAVIHPSAPRPLATQSPMDQSVRVHGLKVVMCLNSRLRLAASQTRRNGGQCLNERWCGMSGRLLVRPVGDTACELDLSGLTAAEGGVMNASSAAYEEKPWGLAKAASCALAPPAGFDVATRSS